MTNHHVIDGASYLYVVFADGRELEATVLGSDPSSDLAVLLVENLPEGIEPVRLGDSDLLSVGQLALAIGSPFSQEFTMTRGIISALGCQIRAGDSNFTNSEIIQTDAPINPGNSGGPLLNRNGEIIGINSEIISNTGTNAGVGFAVPINTAKRVIPELIGTGRVEYAYLGITGATVTPGLAEAIGFPEETQGVLIIDVVVDGPADQAGLSPALGTTTIAGVQYPDDGEIIASIDDTPVNGMDELVAYLAENNKPGDTVTLHFQPSAEHRRGNPRYQALAIAIEA